MMKDKASELKKKIDKLRTRLGNLLDIVAGQYDLIFLLLGTSHSHAFQHRNIANHLLA